MSSSKLVAQFCAICERERKPTSGSISAASLQHGESTAAKMNSLLNNKYRNLPAKKNDDFFTQVTEPQWLRRGNLKESDSVCKRHLAILMRGVDRGSEGGCCSPLHRGARLCSSKQLRTIPPTWRKLFMKHPKIKNEDKEVMMFCWECYKKHMNRMSKYGDPVGKPLGSKSTDSIHRSRSIADYDSGSSSSSSTFQAMKRYKSMDKLTFEQSPHYGSYERRASTSSSSSQPNSGKARFSRSSDTELRGSVAKRSSRGRRSNRGKRSPSPPNNISPVRTSVVHSKRKHSPHKTSKPPSSWRMDKNNGVIETPTSEKFKAPQNRVSTGEVDTEAPRDPPVPPPGLFSNKLSPSGDVFDVTDGKQDQVPVKEGNNVFEDLPPPPPEMTNHFEMEGHEGGQPQIPFDRPILPNGFHYDVRDDEDVLTESVVMQHLSAPRQTEESTTTSADEMAAIFANYNLDDDVSNYDTDDNNNTKLDQQAVSTQTILIPQFVDFSDDTSDLSSIPPVRNHQNQSSSGSSDKTGDTQIELDDFDAQSGEYDQEKSRAEYSQNEDENADYEERSIPTPRNDFNPADESEKPEEQTEVQIKDFTNSVFVSPTHDKDHEKMSSTPRENSTINYSLSPQSSGCLQSVKMQFSEDLKSDEGVEGRKLYFDDDVRERSHPLRQCVLFKVPRGVGEGTDLPYLKIPAEDIEIFPDPMSFLDGITQTVGEDMTMYAQDGPRITSVDLRMKDNRDAHRTSQFFSESLILRRGQPFEIDLTLNENIDKDKHKIMVEMAFGDYPRASNGSHLFHPVQRSGSSSTKYGSQPGGQWSARFLESDDPKHVKISLTSPFTSAVGSYKIYFQVERDGFRSRWQSARDCERDIIILFNPWNIDDAVFMSSQSDRQEYVMSDFGYIFSGNKSNPIALPSIYGQYEPGVLEGCLEVLNASNVSMLKRGDPAAVAKALCVELTNSDASKKFRRDSESDAVAVLKRYLKFGTLQLPRNNKALTGFLVSVFRCLGLPARPTTCYNYAQDADIPMAVHIHFSEDGQSLDHMNSDKIWPSFSWCGVWMSRVDLPPGFGGWQAVLPPFDNHGASGPIPVYGIKKGQTSCCEGTRDHFAALNAEKKIWIVSQDGSMQLAQTQPSFVGLSIVTKSVGSADFQDVTKLYKFPEGCEEQKLAIHTACLHCGSQGFFEEAISSNKLSMSLSTNPSVVNFGPEVEVITTLANKADTVRHLTINIDGAVCSEDGVPDMKLPKETILAEVLPNETVEIPVKFNISSCLHKLSHNHHLVFTAFGKIRELEKENLVIASHQTGIAYPAVEIQMHGEFKVGGEITILAKLRNPLPYRLQNSKIAFSSCGLHPLDIQPRSGISVGPWQVFKAEKTFRGHRAGHHPIVVTFSSDHLNGPVGTQEIEIT